MSFGAFMAHLRSNVWAATCLGQQHLGHLNSNAARITCCFSCGAESSAKMPLTALLPHSPCWDFCLSCRLSYLACYWCWGHLWLCACFCSEGSGQLVSKLWGCLHTLPRLWEHQAECIVLVWENLTFCLLLAAIQCVRLFLSPALFRQLCSGMY